MYMYVLSLFIGIVLSSISLICMMDTCSRCRRVTVCDVGNAPVSTAGEMILAVPQRRDECPQTEAGRQTSTNPIQSSPVHPPEEP